MENKEKKKNRKEWIKNALIIFLLIMLVLTFCSDTIMNMYLPEVSTEAVSAGKLQEIIRGTGTVELNNGYSVKIKESREVKSVNVKAGQQVKTGDILFVLDKSDGTELDAAKTAYLDLQTEYQKKLIASDHNYSKEVMAIEAAKADYDNAVEKLNNIDSQNKQLKSKQDTLAGYDKKIAKCENRIVKYDAKIAELSGKVDKTLAEADLLAKQRVFAGLSNELADISADLELLRKSGADQADITAKEREARDKQVEVNNAQADVNIAQASLNEVDSNIQLLNTTNAKKDSANAKLADYKAKQAAISAEIETLRSGILSKEEAQAQIQEKENTWNSLVADLELKKSEDKVTDENDKIELNTLKQKLIVQKAVVENLMATSSAAEIKAEQDGIVSEVLVNAGDITQPDMALASIASTEGGYSVKISITKDQETKIRQGMQASIENYYYGESSAVVRSIMADAENPGNSLVTFDIKADHINQGDSVTVSVPGESKEYDLIVPKSSVYEDNNGSFVLTMESKRTPLGERYIAVRHDVTVLAKNDTRAAISSDLYGYEYVIVTASEALTPGEQVKLKE